MVALTVTYARMFNLGNFEHERIEVQVSMEEKDSAAEGLAKARAFVEVHSPLPAFGGVDLPTYRQAKNILEHRAENLVKDVEAAERFVNTYESAKAESMKQIKFL